MGKPGKHSSKRRGMPRAPVSMAQLAREGRLKPEVVAEMIRVGKLDSRTIRQLKFAGLYPRRVFDRYSGVKNTVLRVSIKRSKGRIVKRTVRLLRF